MHFPSLVKCLLVVFIQCDAIFGILVFGCTGSQSVGLCIRGHNVDPNSKIPADYARKFPKVFCYQFLLNFSLTTLAWYHES
jgi:hypothetical protein